MKFQSKHILLPFVFCWFGLTMPAFGQKLGSSEAKQLIVEYSHTYLKVRYAEPITFVAGRSMPTLAEDSPEAALANYLTQLAKGDADAALKYWTLESRNLIQRKNASISPEELRKSMISQNLGMNFEFVSRIVYGDYMIIETRARAPQAKGENPVDSYALRKENGAWKLAQDLADDPVMCCRDAPLSRIRKVAVPGRDFRKILEALK